MRVDLPYLDLFSTAASPIQTGNSFFSSLSTKTTGTLLDYCAGCKRARMAAVPQGIFAANKVRANLERASWQRQNLAIDEAEYNFESKQQQKQGPTINQSALEIPMKYNSKLMNSIWGLYNRYSVHNFKKNTDGKYIAIGEHQLNAAVPQSPFFASQKN